MAKRRKKHTGLLVFAVIVLAGGAALYIGKDAIVNTVKTKAIKEISKQLLESQLGSEVTVGGQTVNVSEVIDNMDDADVQKVNDIAEKYVSKEEIGNYVDMVKNGNVSEVKEHAKEQLTEEDKQELQGIYEKYKSQIPIS